jgi:hypothetical protein
MNRYRHTAAVVAFFALLLVIEWFLYFRHWGHFFQGDSVFLLNHRATSLAEYLKEFVALNPSGWYRPLANEPIESILFPIAGLNPFPYRIPVYAVFIAITAEVYALALALTKRSLAAAIAVFFFVVHSVNAYTTFDVGFMPELLYTLFYLAATLAYLRYLDNADKTAYRISLICFIGSLLSKEAAVTLPAALFLAHLLFGPASQGLRQRFVQAIRSTVPHTLILAVYLLFVVGYLRVQSLSLNTLFDTSFVPNPGDYIPVLNSAALKNADVSFSWAFNLPRAEQWTHLSAGMVDYLQYFRALVLVLTTVLLFKAKRNVVLYGWAWFWIALIPALPLVSHFVPYYLFLPVAGVSLIVGIGLAGFYDVINRTRIPIAAATLVFLLGGLLYVTSRTIRADIEHNGLLGASATFAHNTLNDLRAFYPQLPANSTIFFADGQAPLSWQHDSGGLIKMAYGVDIPVLYESLGHSIDPNVKNPLVFAVRNGRLTNETSDAFRFMKFAASDLRLELSAAEVTAGRDKYILSVERASNAPVQIAYTLNDGPLETFAIRLDANGDIALDVSRDTPKGVYRFRAFNISGSTDWFRSDETITVR